MSIPNQNSFGETFIDYIRGIYFNYSPKPFTSEEMFKNMPSFYKDQEMINAAIHILLMRGQVIQIPLTGSTDEYKANPEALAAIRAGIESDKVNKEIDLEIKQRTRDHLRWQRWPMKYWWVVMGLSIVLTAVVTKYIGQKEDPVSPSLTQQEIQALIDNSMNRKKA